MDDKLKLLLQVLIFAFPILIGCISAKRFNFLHGFIATFTMIMVLAGISRILEILPQTELNYNDVLSGVNLNAPAENLKGFDNIFYQYTYYTYYLQIVALPIYTLVIKYLPDISFLKEQPWSVYMAPIVLWIVSRIFAGIFRSRRV